MKAQSEEEFFQHHYTGYIAADAYENYEKPNGLSWLGNPDKFPDILETHQHGQHTVEFRQSGKILQYVATDETGEIIRDARGLACYLSPDEIQSKKLPGKDTSVVAFVGDAPIGLVSNEFGAVGVWVEKAFQKIGIGTKLLHLHVLQRPTARFGQMTPAGIALTKHYFRTHVSQESAHR